MVSQSPSTPPVTAKTPQSILDSGLGRNVTRDTHTTSRGQAPFRRLQNEQKAAQPQARAGTGYKTIRLKIQREPESEKVESDITQMASSRQNSSPMSFRRDRPVGDRPSGFGTLKEISAALRDRPRREDNGYSRNDRTTRSEQGTSYDLTSLATTSAHRDSSRLQNWKPLVNFDVGQRQTNQSSTRRDSLPSNQSNQERDQSRTPNLASDAVLEDDVPLLNPEADASDPFDRHRGVPKSMTANDRRSRIFETDLDNGVAGSTNIGNTQKSVSSRRGGRMNVAGLDFDAADVDEDFAGRRKKKSKRVEPKQAAAKPQIVIPEFMTVEKLAQALKVRNEAFIAKLEEEGFEGARYDHILDASTSTMLAELYGFDPINIEAETEKDLFARPPATDLSTLPPRPPIVTIMGHVDHGKTTILDWLRKSSVVATEHGGITQHIGAFSVTMPGTERQITFLDTPGHAAFLDMRRRGANVTDIVVLVVAADDSVKPQTVEAIKHALEAKVQIIVAINKIDKDDANVERVKQDLSRHEIVVEEYGGDYQSIPVSGKTGQGMSELEEAIITLADVSDFRAETDGSAEGWVIESKVTIAGRVATVLVRRGTLRPGDFIVAGSTWARVRTLRNDGGQLVNEAPPGTPVQVDGWRGADPTAGLEVLQARDEDHAKSVIEYRLEQAETARTMSDMSAINAARTEEAEARAKVLAWRAEQNLGNPYRRKRKENEGWVEKPDSSGLKKVHFLIKADVAGSVEALEAAVSAIGNNEIVANVIHTGIGQLSESDMQLLASTGETGYAISFNQPIEGTIRRLAEAADLKILDHNIIYKVTDDVREKVSDALPPLITQKVLGEAEIGQIFEVTIKRDKIKIAGCKVTNGTISRSNPVRVMRDNVVVYTGTLASLKNVKKDVTEMRKGSECGMGFDDWSDFEEGDQIQSYEQIEEKRKLY